MTGLALTASAADEKKANATGTWKWTVQGRGGGQAREVTAKLKQDGEKLTGTVSGRQGGTDAEIKDGKVKGNEISFVVVRMVQNNEITTTYEGKIDGDTLKGKISTKGGQQERPAIDWEAKREKDAAK